MWGYIWLLLVLISALLLGAAFDKTIATDLERNYGRKARETILNIMFAAGLLLAIIVSFWGPVLGLRLLSRLWDSLEQEVKYQRYEGAYQRYEQAKAETFMDRLGREGRTLAQLTEVELRTERLEEMLSEVMKLLVSFKEQGCQAQPSDKAVASTGAPAQACAW
jgi:uncharacterized membrane protein YciS (DUF1049 family)